MGRSRAAGSSVRGGEAWIPRPRERTHEPPRTAPSLTAVTRPKIPMSKDARRELLDALRYMLIDVLESNRGRWVAAIVFLASWGTLAMWFLPWGLVLGWIPAAALAIPIGYVCR